MLVLLVQLSCLGVTPDATNLVANSIDQRLPQVRLQGALVARLEVVDVPEGLHKRLLHQVFSVAEITSPAREPAASPPPERTLMPTNEIVERLRIAPSGAAQ